MIVTLFSLFFVLYTTNGKTEFFGYQIFDLVAQQSVEVSSM
jgi:hypothetical protein